ncbi:MAG: MATE family efflux transporter [Rikenellaceae bacterium]
MLAIPIILSQLGQIIVQVADNTMVGQYGGDNPLPLAAASFGGGVFFISYITAMGLTLGITPIVGELFAQGKESELGKYLQNGFVLHGFIAVLTTILQYCVMPLMWKMGQPNEVVAMAIPYYQTLVWSLIPVIMFCVIKQFLEGIGNTKIAMYATIAGNAINIVLNYMLIWGKFGAPELGVLGAGIATLTARITQCAILMLYFFLGETLRKYRESFSRLNFSKDAIVRLFKMGLPISLQILLEASSFAVAGFIIGLWGAEAITANQIALTMGNCTFMIIIALSSSTTIVVSHCFGRGDIKEMKMASRAALHLMVIWNTLSAVAYFSLRDVLPTFFTSNAEVIELASSILIFFAAYQLTDGIQAVGVGVLRGMQEVKMIPWIALVSYWLCNFPLGYYCASVLEMGPAGIYVGFFVGFFVACVALCYCIVKREKSL